MAIATSLNSRRVSRFWEFWEWRKFARTRKAYGNFNVAVYQVHLYFILKLHVAVSQPEFYLRAKVVPEDLFSRGPFFWKGGKKLKAIGGKKCIRYQGQPFECFPVWENQHSEVKGWIDKLYYCIRGKDLSIWFLEGCNVWQSNCYWSSTERNAICFGTKPNFLITKDENKLMLVTLVTIYRWNGF